jgi:heme a synthase
MAGMGFRRLVLAALLLTLVVVVLGAWVRLTDAGLGCPDWPGCYGALTVPGSESSLERAAQAWPERPVDSGKAWREMIHRYAASTLGLLVIAISVIGWRRRREPGHPFKLPLAIMVLIVFQGLLGMWTVTLLLKPVIVMAHLLGGMTILALLWWLLLRSADALRPREAAGPMMRRLATVALVIVAAQIALGGWTSANYAALACPDFPTCQTQWWPDMDFGEGFVLWREIGVDYEGGILDASARAAIHKTHRIGALVTFLFVGALSLALLLRGRDPVYRRIGAAVGVLLLAQVTVGIVTVVKGLPLALAVAHNGFAALLLLSVVALNHSVHGGRR